MIKKTIICLVLCVGLFTQVSSMNYSAVHKFSATGSVLAAALCTHALKRPLVSGHNYIVAAHAAGAAVAGYALTYMLFSRHTPAGLIKRAQKLLDNRNNKLVSILQDQLADDNNMLIKILAYYPDKQVGLIAAHSVLCRLLNNSYSARCLLLEAKNSDYITAADLVNIQKLLKDLNKHYFCALHAVLQLLEQNPEYMQQVANYKQRNKQDSLFAAYRHLYAIIKAQLS